MKKSFKSIAAAVLTVSVLSTSGFVMAAETTYGASAAAQDNDLTLSDMLTYSIQDEYLAQAEYEAIMEEYGTRRPFSNIIKAEGRHIEELLPLFESHDITVPENSAASQVVLPDSLSEIYAAGVHAEELNIDMYQEFLSHDLPDDVRDVFENLLAGSEKHLKAFERAGSRVSGIGAQAGTGRTARSGNRSYMNGTSSSQGQAQNFGLGRGLGRGVQ